MDKKEARRQLDEIIRDLNNAVKELRTIAKELRSNFRGIGEDYCANSLENVADKYSRVISSLRKVD